MRWLNAKNLNVIIIVIPISTEISFCFVAGNVTIDIGEKFERRTMMFFEYNSMFTINMFNNQIKRQNNKL